MTHPWQRLSLAALAAVAALSAAPRDARAIRVVTWNLWQYSSAATSFPTRQPSLRAVMPLLDPDVLITQEMNNSAGADSFLINVLNVYEPGEWTGTWRNVGAGEGMGLFWKPGVVGLDGIVAVANTAGPRLFLLGRVTPVGYVANSAKFLIYSVHLKAGSSATDSTTRRLECTFLRNNYLNITPPTASGGNFMVGGDYNMQDGGLTDFGYTRLVESAADDDGRCKDPINPSFYWSPSWHNNSGFAYGHTQCPCLTCPYGGMSGGGLDDRFDMWLTSYSMQDGQGLDYVSALAPGQLSYPFVFGNDGAHYNMDVNGGGGNGSVGLEVANALWNASDHLPVVITIQVPAKIVAESELDFGDVIVGATYTVPLNVANGAVLPADKLDYSFGAPAGFSAPVGAFLATAGQAATAQPIGIDAASSGVQTGTLVVNCDDPDSSAKNVRLAGRVLEHAVGSLDSLVTTTLESLDLGTHAIGAFPDSFVRVHNRQTAALEARLSLDGGAITGGAGRFSIVGGFSGGLLADVGRTFNVHFDDTGATLDSTYTATLTFSVSDEPLPGATPGTDLVVELSARPASGTVDVLPQGPTVLRFDPPRPNPVSSATQFAFELPNAAPVDLAIFDLTGRRVATLAHGEQAAGRHVIRWDTRDDRGARLSAGVYFVSFATPGLTRMNRVVVLP
jgi:FlgD Ig-like domain